MAVTTTLTIDAPAKVNLCLAVQYPPQDGYHWTDSVFQTLDLHDTLTFDVRDAVPDDAIPTQMGTPVSIVCEPSLGLRHEDNLVFRAVDAMERACGVPMVKAGQSVHVQIEKRIPAGGGLAGGSSNAAATIRIYAQMHGIDRTDERCLRAARAIGSDVAFFLYGGAMLMTGHGDVPVRDLPAFPLPLVLMGDARGNPTATVYGIFDDDPQPMSDVDALVSAMRCPATSPGELAASCANSLQEAAFAATPSLRMRVQRASEDEDVLAALVTGTGSTAYAICPDLVAARRFAERAEEFCDWVRVTMPIG